MNTIIENNDIIKDKSVCIFRDINSAQKCLYKWIQIFVSFIYNVRKLRFVARDNNPSHYIMIRITSEMISRFVLTLTFDLSDHSVMSNNAVYRK